MQKIYKCVISFFATPLGEGNFEQFLKMFLWSSALALLYTRERERQIFVSFSVFISSPFSLMIERSFNSGCIWVYVSETFYWQASKINLSFYISILSRWWELRKMTVKIKKGLTTWREKLYILFYLLEKGLF